MPVNVSMRNHHISFTDPEKNTEVSFSVHTSGPGNHSKRNNEEAKSAVFLNLVGGGMHMSSWLPKEVAEEFALAILAELKSQELEDAENSKS